MSKRYWGLLTPWSPRQLMWDRGMPLLFFTRSDARRHANERFGYIKTRKDLRTYPHNWTMPKTTRVVMSLRKAGEK